MILFFGLIIGMILTFIVYGAYILLIAFTLWMAVDAGKQDRFWWMVLIIGIPVIGAAVYYVTEKKHEYAKVESHHIHDTETEVQHEKTPEKHPHHKKEEKAQEGGNGSDKKVETPEEKAA